MQEILIQSLPTSFELNRELAINLWQAGEYNRARDVLLSMLVDADNLEGSHLLIVYNNLALIEWSAGNYQEALRILREAAPLADASDNITLQAKHLNGLATVHLRLRNYDAAIQAYTGASVLHEKARNFVEWAEVENNIGDALVEAGRPGDAHSYLDTAMRICRDAGAKAQICETRARAFKAEGRIEEARDAICQCLRFTLEAGAGGLLPEHLATYLSLFNSPFNVSDLSHALEARDIQSALIEAKGSVYRAAPKLGLTCEGLRYKLENQHRNLQYLRRPKRRSPNKKQ